MVRGPPPYSGKIELNTKALERQLEQDAEAGSPPFGAESIATARRLGRGATDLLLGRIRARGRTAFLALEALRAADENAFTALPTIEKAEIYSEALSSNVFFNAWGVPGYQLTETSRALISLGEEAIDPLRRLLDKQEPAPLSGSQEATTSRMYGNRIRDYAWVFINEILGHPYVYALDPAERDARISDLRRALGSDQGNAG
jgi:hypothetical protein